MTRFAFRHLLTFSLVLSTMLLVGGQPAPVDAQSSSAIDQVTFVDTRGFIGIGTDAPTNPLHVVGVGSREAAVFESAEDSENAGIRLRPGGTAEDETANDVVLSTMSTGGFGILTYDPPGQKGQFRLTMSRNGRVGIGTSTPSEQLEVVGDLKLSNGPGGPGDLLLHNAELGYSGVALSGSNDGTNTLVVNAVNTFAGGVQIQSNVGIDGSATVDGTLTANIIEITGGGDLAEPFEIADADAIQPGMVVVIDPDNPGQLRLSTAAYNRTVAGVVSGAGGIEPGVLMYKDGAGENTHPVALSGRVYVYADAANGIIVPGDLLTTSGTPGYAMKVTDYERAHGAILGKAMSRLEEGTGLLLVLVTLQ